MKVYYYNKNKLYLGIQEFEVLREKYLVESGTHNTEIKYLETNYDIDRDKYYSDSDWLEDIDIKWIKANIMFHDTRIRGEVYLSYYRDKLKEKYIEDSKDECRKLRYQTRLITQKMKEYEKEPSEELEVIGNTYDKGDGLNKK